MTTYDQPLRPSCFIPFTREALGAFDDPIGELQRLARLGFAEMVEATGRTDLVLIEDFFEVHHVDNPHDVRGTWGAYFRTGIRDAG